MNKYLVTGGSGFLGERLIERLYEREPDCKIVTVARNEGKLIMLKERFPDIEIVPGNIGNNYIVKKIMMDGDFTGIFHLAAFKHVGLAENNVPECIHSNIDGTINILNESVMQDILNDDLKFCIGISTDKAAQVSGVYGASKLLMERLFKDYENHFPSVKFRIVRYGNVLYSTGSVLCKWKDLIQQGKELIVTDLSATRFFWTRDQAIDLIFECLENAKNSTPYVPEMKSIKIDDLLTAMYMKYGEPKEERKIKIIGLQPGENLHEKIIEDGPTSNEVEKFTIDEIIQMI